MRLSSHAMTALAAATAMALALASCGLHDPDATIRATTSHVGTVTVVDNEVRLATPPTEPPAPRTTADTTPRAAVLRFARLYTTWTYRNLAARQRQLARLSVGTAAAAERRAARRTPGDYELRRGKVANHGTVVSLAPDARGHGQWVIVTLEQTTADTQDYQDLPAGYHVTLAAVRRVRGGYAVSRWQPQN